MGSYFTHFGGFPRAFRQVWVTSTCLVRWECRLIQYLETEKQQSWGNIPLFDYIGVSKLSCSPCRIQIGQFNKLDGTPAIGIPQGKYHFPCEPLVKNFRPPSLLNCPIWILHGLQLSLDTQI